MRFNDSYGLLNVEREMEDAGNEKRLLVFYIIVVRFSSCDYPPHYSIGIGAARL